MNIRPRSVRAVLLLLLLLAWLPACGNTDSPAADVALEDSIAEAATATIEPTDTPEPTATATLTPLPSDTPTSTPTPTDTPTPTPEPVTMVQVLDEASGEAIRGATVELSSDELGAVFSRETDADGNVTFESVPAGDYVVIVSATGYVSKSQEDVNLIGIVTLDYELMPIVTVEVISETAVLRGGPGTVYARAGTVEAGDTFEVVGQNEDASWLILAVEDDDGEMAEAWIAAEAVELTGELETVAVFEAPHTPTPAPTVPTSTPEPTATSEAPEYITLYYASNPSDILGVFPVRPFDGDALYNNMVRIRNGLYTMRDALPGAKEGDTAACSSYTAAYNSILNSGVVYDDVPPDWDEIDFYYVLSFIYSLDRTRPAYLSCVDSGRIDDFNFGLATQAIDQTLNLLNPTIGAAGGKLGR